MAEDIVKDLFGETLAPQGRGFYVTLELLSIVWGTNKLAQECAARGDELPNGPESVLPTGDLDLIHYQRRSHDFARRLMAGGPSALDDSDREHLDENPDTPEAIAALMQSLQVPLPFSRKQPNWLGLHLYPFVGELIHYDAAKKRGSGAPGVERYLYRGAGGLVHEMLRRDQDQTRLGQTRAALTELVADAETPLGRLAGTLASHAQAPDSPLADDVACAEINTDSPWVEMLRNGVHNILLRDSVRSKKVEHLMYWVPYCVARYQLDVSSRRLGRDEPVLLADVGAGGQLRSMSRAQLARHRRMIEQALDHRAHELWNEARNENDPISEEWRLLTEQTKWKTLASSFFTGTLATISGLNANVGNRHYTMGLSLIEAVVAGLLEPNEVVEFDDFCQDHLRGRLRVSIDGASASADSITTKIDRSEFRKNERGFADDLHALGLLTQYSDATRLVRLEQI